MEGKRIPDTAEDIMKNKNPISIRTKNMKLLYLGFTQDRGSKIA